MDNYVELHCHSNFSLLDGASHPEELVARAHQLGMPALAITDHDGLYGAVRFYKAARESGIKPVIGAEVTLEDESHIILLARNKAGYTNLCRLITRSHMGCGKGEASLDPAILEHHSQGLICLSGCRKGEVAAYLLKDEPDKALEAARKYSEIFGRQNFFVELQNNYLEGDAALCRRLIQVAREAGVGCAATNNVHYSVPEKHRLQDIMVCIKNRVTLDKSSRFRRPNFEYYLKSGEEMALLFKDCPEALANTVMIADRCSVDLDFEEYHFPDFSLPRGETAMSYLRKLCYRGAVKRYQPLTVQATNQLEHELNVIERMNLAGYFLIVWDIMRHAAEQGIPAQGRGSAADSIVAYVLGITRVDPLMHNLLFERFLNEEMKGTPDIDIDISSNHREELIQYVYRKYGEAHTAMVATVITFQARNALREVGKALSIPEWLIDRLSKSIDVYSASHLKEAFSHIQEFKDNEALLEKHFVPLCQEIADFPRHLSIHVGGMIISSCPLTDIVPLEPATAPGRVVTQWNKDDVEEVGLIKVDLLGLRMLSLIHDALGLIEEHRGVKPDLDSVPLDDPEVYRMLCRADTVGVFQVESRAQMQTLPVTKPRCLDDLVVEVAIVRPGPLQGNMVHPYLRRRQGLEKVTYLHPALQPALEETHGVILFQEQVIKVAVAVAGFSPGEADQLRRAMGKQRSREEMEKVRQRFISGAAQKGINGAIADQIYDQIASFAAFGFCKSHAAAFARTCYESAYIKVHYPAEFYCALLNNQPMGFYTPDVIVNDAKRHGVNILPVDINDSRDECTLEDGRIRIGFRYVKEVGEAASSKIIKAREQGRFSSLEDCYFRTGLHREAVDSLILVGAFDSFGVPQRQLLWKAGLLVKEEPLALPLTLAETEVLLPEVTPLEQMAVDYKIQGLSPRYHPIPLLRDDSEGRLVKTSEVANLGNNARVCLAGYVVSRQAPSTAKGMVFLTLEDEDGLINIVVRPQVYEEHRRLIRLEPLLMVEGVVQTRDGVVNILAEKISPLHRPEKGQSPPPAPPSEGAGSRETKPAETLSGDPCRGRSSRRSRSSSY